MALTVVDQGLLGTYAQYTGFKNRILNGQMVIDQRNAGASVTPSSNGTYLVDRWNLTFSQASKFSAQQNAGSVTPPSGYINYLGLTVASSVSVGAGDYFAVQQIIEGLNVADLAWGSASAATVTLSFWVRSSLTGTFGGALSNSAGSRSYPFTYTISSANTWEQKSITIAGDQTGTWLTTSGAGIYLRLGLGAGSTYSGTAGSWAASNYFTATGAVSVVGTGSATLYFTGVQLEKGSTATSFDYRPYGTELQLCQRYYDVLLAANTDYNIGGTRDSTTTFQTTLYSAVPMRTTPTLGVPSGYGRLVCYDTSFSLTVASISAMSLSYAPDNRVLNIFMTTSSVSGAGSVFFSYDTFGTSTGMTVSAEL